MDMYYYHYTTGYTHTFELASTLLIFISSERPHLFFPDFFRCCCFCCCRAGSLQAAKLALLQSGGAPVSLYAGIFFCSNAAGHKPLNNFRGNGEHHKSAHNHLSGCFRASFPRGSCRGEQQHDPNIPPPHPIFSTPGEKKIKKLVNTPPFYNEPRLSTSSTHRLLFI